MPVVSILSASYCHGDEIARKVSEILSYKYIGEQLLAETAQKQRLSKEKFLTGILESSTGFLRGASERIRYTAHFRAALAGLLTQDKIVYHGIATLLVPIEVSHVLRVCLVGDIEFRLSEAVRSDQISDREARSRIKRADTGLFDWAEYLHSRSPWDETLYDIVIPVHTLSIEEAVGLIVENARKEALVATPQSQKAVNDFQLASQVSVALAEKKHDVDVAVADGRVIITLKKYVMRLEHYKEELKKTAREVPGVADIDFKIGQTFKMPSTWPPVDFEAPKKILLVDDEKDFVQTLSERLQTRKIATSIAYNGEEALSQIEKDEPEVMVLDLKMPGIDGIEVLRQVKKEHPLTEVIILTGHGSEKERQIAMELGAFAYLEKPVDINVLAQTMKEAYARVNRTKSSGAGQ